LLLVEWTHLEEDEVVPQWALVNAAIGLSSCTIKFNRSYQLSDCQLLRKYSAPASLIIINITIITRSTGISNKDCISLADM
jgi:hypothetical protein